MQSERGDPGTISTLSVHGRKISPVSDDMPMMDPHIGYIWENTQTTAISYGRFFRHASTFCQGWKRGRVLACNRRWNRFINTRVMQKRSTVSFSLLPSSFLTTIYIWVPIYLRLSPPPFVSIRLFAPPRKERGEKRGRVRAFYRVTLNETFLQQNWYYATIGTKIEMLFATGEKYIYIKNVYKSRLKSLYLLILNWWGWKNSLLNPRISRFWMYHFYCRLFCFIMFIITVDFLL